MLVGCPPFMDDNKNNLYRKILYSPVNFKNIFGNEIELSHHSKDLICQLLHKDPDQRIKPNDIPIHPFFAGVNFDDIFMGKVRSPFIPKVNSFDDFTNIDPSFLKEDCFSPPKKFKNPNDNLSEFQDLFKIF